MFHNGLIAAALCCSLILCSPFSYAKQTIALKHQNAAPVLDGIIDEALWQNAARFELSHSYKPSQGTPAPVKTVAFIYEDGSNLHIALEASDPNPEKILAHLSDRDDMWGDDWLGIILDTFNDERSAYEFYVNPKGVQHDGRMDDSDGWRGDNSWNGIWYSAAKVTETGWSAEISIPFKALRFPPVNGDGNQQRVWAFSFFRAYPREVAHWISSTKRDPNTKCNICQFDKMQGFASVKPGKNFQLTPTLTAGKTQSREDVPGDWDIEKNTDAGLDIRWGMTPNSVLNVMLNPDFSQVDADSAQLSVNNTYSLYLPERRAFFLDGADYFKTNNFNFVHTRNIAESDAGLKLTGKNGNHSYGLLLANDQSTSFVIPGNQSSDVGELTLEDPLDPDDETPIGSEVAIARYRMDVADRGNIGGLITQRQGDGYRNSLASVDGSTWLSEIDSLRYQFAYSDTLNPEPIQNEFNLAPTQSDRAFALRYFRDTYNYRISADYYDVGEDFRADMGFHTKSDFKELSLGGMRKYHGNEGDIITNQYYYFDWDYVVDQQGKRIENELKLVAGLDGAMQSHSELSVNGREKYYDNDFNSGEYFDERFINLYTRFNPLPAIKLELNSKLADQIDYDNGQPGSSVFIRAAVDMRLGEHIKFRVAHNYSTLAVDASDYMMNGALVAFDKGNLFNANQTDMRFNYQFSIRSQLKLVVQYTDISRRAELYRANFDLDEDNNVESVERLYSSQLVYSYKINSQSLFFLGYSDSGFQDDLLDGMEKDYQSVFAKISYAWQS